ncbi:hypothetical protein ACHAW5_002121 [Stephanodiscus triporus]|uniref:Uncharacterized protein n=1 Tax=Stephanodiscus triporus TaxID=2934178 RepID=A0ABD3MPP6_9STRA
MKAVPQATPPLTPGHLDKIIHSPHIGYLTTANRSLEVFVIGTSHFRCNSAQEVTSLIEQVRPDGVVLELDPERVLRLTKRYAGFDANGDRREKQSSHDVLYGADFIAAVNACQQLDIPMFLGDEYAHETKRRLTQQFLNWGDAYSPAPFVQSIVEGMRSDEDMHKSRIDLFQSFVNDPQKLTPIVLTSTPPFLIASALALFDNGAMAYDGSVLLSSMGITISILSSFLASCLLFNTVIVERDKIIASNTIHAYNVVRSLKDNDLIRKRWRFTAKGQNKPSDNTELINASESLPLFTLKSPLVKGAIRNLHLFEPRWLNMIDEVTKAKDPLDEKMFGCVRCTNKFYSAVSVNGVEGRYADVIFETAGTFAKIKQIREGKRAVSGDRKISVSIEGGDSFIVDVSSLSVSNDGYMVAIPNVEPNNRGLSSFRSSQETSKERITLVVVVGLLHGNGVVDLLSKI